jgi:hypothetical protein
LCGYSRVFVCVVWIQQGVCMCCVDTAGRLCVLCGYSRAFVCVADRNIPISSSTKYGPFQLTAVCSHAQSAGPTLLAAEVTSVP